MPSDTPLMAPTLPTPIGGPNAPLCYLYPSGPQVPTVPASPQYTLTPPTPSDAPNGPTPPRSSQCPLMTPIPLLVVNCHHFATDHLHTVKMLIFCHCHFHLSFSLYNWPSSRVHPVYKIPSLGVRNTSSVLWSSGNFCSISKNMHYKVPVALQHWKTNKVVWTWKDDWPPGELLHTKDLLPKRVTI